MNLRDGSSETETSSLGQGPFSSRAVTFLLMSILALLPGCKLLQAPSKVVSSVVPTGRSTAPDPLALQAQEQRFADEYSSQTATAVDEYARRVGTESARIQALHWKLAAATAAISIASGPQPKANLIDLVSLATLSRMAVYDYWTYSNNPTAFQPWYDACQALETNAWNIAEGNLTSPQVRELRDAIDRWHIQNSGIRGLFASRPQEFASMVKMTQRNRNDVNSVFALVGLDPAAGLDPAVHEITLTRLFAERAIFIFQRMPSLLRWQVELLSYRVAEQPAVQTVLTNTVLLSQSMDRISHAADRVSGIAAQLPEQIAAERKAVLAALEQQEGKLHDLAIEVDHSLVSAEKMSGSLTITITNFDALMKRFGVGEPSTNTVPDTNSTPFNILDYAKTADQIGSMAKDLNLLITSVNQNVPQVERLGQQASADAQRVVDRAFRLVLILIGTLLVGAVIAGLVYRVLADRLKRDLPPSTRSNS